MCSEAGLIETGGVLIGRYNKTHNMALITRIYGPPADSQKGQNTFVRGTKGLQQLIDKLWRVNEYYLGEWHFHPRGTARPSPIDVRQMRRISASDEHHCPEPILIVVGGNPPFDWEAAAYVFQRDREVVRLGQLPL